MDRDIVIIEQWISFGRRVLRWFTLLRLGMRRLSSQHLVSRCALSERSSKLISCHRCRAALRFLYCRGRPKGSTAYHVTAIVIT